MEIIQQTETAIVLRVHKHPQNFRFVIVPLIILFFILCLFDRQFIPIFIVILLIAFLLIALFLFLQLESTYTLDKSTGVLRTLVTSIFGIKAIDYMLSDIQQIAVRKNTTYPYYRSSQLLLVLKTNNQMILIDSAPTNKENPLFETGRKLATFLQIPFTEEGTFYEKTLISPTGARTTHFKLINSGTVLFVIMLTIIVFAVFILHILRII